MIDPVVLRICAALSVGLSLACSSDPGSGDAAESSSGTGSADHTGSGSEDAPTTDDPTADTTGSDGSTAADTSDDSTGVDTEPDAYDGDWCGNASTGRVDIASYADRILFTGEHDSPFAFVGWITTDDAIQVAIYDVAAASWAEPETLLEDYAPYWAGDAPAGSVDADGNALVGYVRQDPGQAVIHRYRQDSGMWTSEDLPGALVSPETGGLTTTPVGHAVFAAYDQIDRGFTSEPWLWFYDPVAETWSEPIAAGGPNSSAHVEWAQDAVSGDAAVVLRDEADDVLALHRDATTGEVTSTSIDPSAFAEVVVALGDGEFLALTSTGGFGKNGEVHGHHYADGAWGAPETIGNGLDVGPIRLVADADGRAVASWNDSLWGTHARSFDRDAGWGDPLVANPTNPTALTSWADHRVALDDTGFTIAYSISGDGGGIRTWARHYEGGDWTTPVELAPNQPTHSRISLLESLGTDRLRAGWSYLGESDYHGYAYACHTPVSGWSDPVVTADYVVVVENRNDGEVLVVGSPAAADSAYVDYYAAP